MNFFVYTASVLVKKSKNRRNGSRIFRFSYSKCGRAADLAIAYRKKQIVLCPNINGNDKEWCKEFVETMVKKELEKLETELEEVVPREDEDTIINKKIARIKKLSTAISRTCVQLLIVHLYARGIVSGVNNLIWTYLPKSCIFAKNII